MYINTYIYIIYYLLYSIFILTFMYNAEEKMEKIVKFINKYLHIWNILLIFRNI